jgi:hypothetical protein
VVATLKGQSPAMASQWLRKINAMKESYRTMQARLHSNPIWVLPASHVSCITVLDV